MNFQDQFPLLNTTTYLNTASSGILSGSLLDWRKTHDQDFFNNGSIFRNTQASFLQSVRISLSAFFGVKTENTFLVPNFSFGFNTFLEGLSGKHRFLLTQEDYPSVNYPVQSRGFECAYLPIDENIEENILAKIKTFKPTVLALSLIQYISGIRISLDFIKELKRDFPDLIIVGDATQFCGTSAFNFEESGLDVLIASGYKWMLGGYGNGFVFIKDQVRSLLYTEAQKAERPTEPFLLGKDVLSLFFEPGHQDTLAFGTLQQSLFFFEKTGMDFIQKHLEDLGRKATSALLERGLIHKSIGLRKQHSTIFSLNVPENKLLEQNIICSYRGGGTRVSFHFYNTQDDLQRLLEVLDKLPRV